MSRQHGLLMILSLLAAIQLCSAAGSDWSYSGNTGPEHWKDSHPTCAGSKQSPINIEPSKATYKDLSSLTLAGYDTAAGHVFTLKNNGHTVQLDVESGPEMTVSGGDLPGTFKLVQFHFHWGSSDSRGSEHTVEGKMYPVEIHFVHYNKKYADIGAAVHQADGLAVLGIFVEVGTEENAGIAKLIAKFPDVKYKAGTTSVDSFALRSLLPANTKDFIRYPGSLTTPGCNEVVTWTVFSTPITITSAQMAKFRELMQNAQGQGTDAALVDNYRPVQALNDRTVYTSMMTSGAAQTAGHLLLALIASLITLCVRY